MRLVDDFLNKYTMYFVMLWALRFLAGVSVVLSVLGLLPFNPINEIFSFIFLVESCYLFNQIFAKLFKAPANKESYIITGLILYLILLPADSMVSVVTLALAAFFAMGSKYLLAINRKHIFNPAAFSLVILGLIGSPQAQWWVSSQNMFPFVLITGLLVVRKVRKFQMFSTFLIVALTTIFIFTTINHADFISIVPLIFTSWPLLFLGSIMLVEPLTTPPQKKYQLIYGAIVGFLVGAQYRIGPFFSTAELALVMGNIFSYVVSFKERLLMIFEEKKEIAPGIYEFIFRPQRKFAFSPGQYLEWTLPHHADKRGVRRFFSIASSPTEDRVRLGIKIGENASTYKRVLSILNPGDKIFAGDLAGDFILPKDKAQKLAFIAGGIGITPFRSMVKYLVDQKEQRDIVLFYSCSKESDFVFNDIFEAASREIGLKLVCITDRLNIDQIKKEIPDYKERKFYMSGPNSMVDNYKKLLKKLGIHPHKIITDYFPGY